MLEFVDVKSDFFTEGILKLLAPSVFNPTPERLKKRAEIYSNNPNAQIFACRLEGKFVGIAVVEIIETIATVLDIAVVDSHRNQGIGSAMLTYFIDNYNLKKMVAETDDDAVLFYQKFGFKIAETKTVYDTKRYVLKFTK